MPKYLVLQLRGVMQSWGTHTYEDFRPSSIFPTRSALIGLLGACMGIERDDIESRERLHQTLSISIVSVNPQKIRKVEDFHTVRDARKVDGKPRKDAIISKREYLCDANFLLFVSVKNGIEFSLAEIENAVKKPVFTPFLGRKSCPITEPLFKQYIETTSITDAIKEITREANILYAEDKLAESSEYQIRDIPVKSNVRQFEKRSVYILSQGGV
jgi:CRISPR system Cascade subunit CasD